MDLFTTKYAEHLRFVLSGFDRLVLRGSLRRLCFPEGVQAYLYSRKVLLKDFQGFVKQLTGRIKEASLAEPRAAGVPEQYLASAATSKEEVARRIARERGVTQGPVCVLSSVEPCHSFDIYKNKAAQKLEVVSRYRKCLHLYHYQVHPVFGFLSARLQTWFPFSIQICLNGREWLAQQLGAEGIGFSRQDNCFLHVEDPRRAQELLEAQLQGHWPTLLGGIARALNPLHEELFGGFCADYYWSTYQSEWATDLVFGEPEALRRLYPRFIRHGMTTLSSPDVLRFLGRKLGAGDRLPARFAGEVTSDVKVRAEGVRIKHRVNRNSVKIYDKAYTEEVAVLRAETTLNSEQGFRAYRAKEGDASGELAWRPLRRGMADLHRRAEISQAVNGRYLEALASVDTEATLAELTERLTQAVVWNGKRVRGLRLFAEEDTALLEAVSRGEFALSGVRNRDLQGLLSGAAADLAPEEVKRRSARVTRQLRMLRAHGLLQKVPHTHRYHVTHLGRQIITALLTARHTPVRQLLPEAA